MSTEARIPFVALDRQHEQLTGELEAAFKRVVGSSAFILGPEVEAFEQEFAELCEAPHCVGVGSGTAALALALQAAGIGPGDEVIVPAHTFIASALAPLHVGATPVLCDVRRGDGLIDPASAEAAVTDKTAAIIAVHLYGQCADMESLRALADKRKLLLVEDAAQAHAATFDGRPAGSMGDIAGFSFYPSKNLGALGDGGAVCTSHEDLADKVRALRHLGQPKKGLHLYPGWNERLDGLQAALLRTKLPHIRRWNDERRDRAAALRAALGDGVGLLEESERSPCIYHLFPVRVDDREALASALDRAGVDSGIHYSPSLDAQPALEGRIRTPVEIGESQAWAAEELSLPIFAELRDDEISRIAAACSAFAAA